MKQVIFLLCMLPIFWACDEETTAPGPDIPQAGVYEASEGDLKAQLTFTSTTVQFDGFITNIWVVSFKGDFTATRSGEETILTLTSEMERTAENGPWQTSTDKAGTIKIRSVTATTFQAWEDEALVWQTYSKI